VAGSMCLWFASACPLVRSRGVFVRSEGARRIGLPSGAFTAGKMTVRLSKGAAGTEGELERCRTRGWLPWKRVMDTLLHPVAHEGA